MPADAPPHDPDAPRARVLRPLAVGGMGALWLAERALPSGATQRAVIKRPLARDEAALARFADEVRALARVEHANVARLLDAGRDGEGPWMLVVTGRAVPRRCTT